MFECTSAFLRGWLSILGITAFHFVIFITLSYCNVKSKGQPLCQLSMGHHLRNCNVQSEQKGDVLWREMDVS